MQEISNSAELERVRGIAEAARLTADRAQRRVNALDSEIGRYERRGVRLFFAVILLVVLTGTGAWALNARLTAQQSSIAKVVGAEGLLNGLSQRLSSAETTLKAIPSQWSDVSTRVDTLDKKVSAARVPDSPTNAEFEKRIAQLNERVASLQAQRQEDGTQLASLRDELATTRNGLSPQTPTARVETPRSTAAAIPDSRPAAPRRQEGLSSIAAQADRDLHGFEITTEKANEVVPGVLLTVKETNVDRQEINGWVYLQEQHRFVYLKNHGLREPITVVDTRDHQPHQIVFTRIRKGDAVGYVSSPKNAVSASAAN
jgi:chaperonin cofactor prefoldin